MREIDLLFFLAPFVEREIDDPAEAEGVLLDQIELLADPGARRTGQLGGLIGLAGGEEAAVVGAKAQRRVQREPSFLAVVLGDRAAELAGLAGDIAKPGMAFRARPFVHFVKELAALVRRARRRDRADHAAAADDLLEQAEARLREMLGDIA